MYKPSKNSRIRDIFILKPYFEVDCLRCGKHLTFYFNDGEQDVYRCDCGLIYRTVVTNVDLVISEEGE